MLKTDPILTAVADHINAHATFGGLDFMATAVAETFTTGTIIVEAIQTPIPESLTWDGAHDRVETVIQTTVVAETLTHARLAADEVRHVLAGKSGRAYAYPLTIPNQTVDSVTTNGDGSHDYDARTGQWTERYTIRFQ